MKIRVTTGDWGGDYEVATGRDAVKAFFKDVTGGKIKMCQLSPLGMWTDGKEKYPFRIAPALFKAGIISAEDLAENFKAMDLDFEPVEIMAMVTADSWMVE
jgi:hypothetical protein